MKVIGVEQLLQKKYTFLPLGDQWKQIMGKLPKQFIAIVYGDSGNGKTEFCIRLAKQLSEWGRVAWVSYEQGHGADMQAAAERNHLRQESKKFLPIDPLENVPDGHSLFDDLMHFLDRRSSPDFVFIDSIDFTGFTKEQYKQLKLRYRKKKALIFISHCHGKLPKSGVGKYIKYDGQIGIYVRNYIAHPVKNRFGGNERYVIWEDEARKREPMAFPEPGEARRKQKQKVKNRKK